MKPEQLTAWALNELSDEEKAQIETLLTEDTEAQKNAAQTKDFCDFLTTELGDDTLAFTPEQRERLSRADDLAAVPSSPNASPKPPKQTSFWRRHAIVNLAAAAAVVVGTTVMIRQQMDSEVQREEALAMRPVPPTKKGEGTLDDSSLAKVAPPATPLPTIQKKQVVVSLQEAKNKLEIGDFDGSISTFKNVLNADPTNSAARNGMEKAEQSKADFFASVAENGRNRMINDISGSKETAPLIIMESGAMPAPAAPVTSTQPAAESTKSGSGSLALQSKPSEIVGLNTMPAPTSDGGDAPKDLYSGTTVVTKSGVATRRDSYGNVSASAPANAGEGALFDSVGAKIVVGYDSQTPASAVAPSSPPALRMYYQSNEPQFGRVDDKGGFGNEADKAPNTESYTQIVENVLKDVMREPLSTFSIDVDTASYANVRRFLNQNSAPPRDAVRIEELINYFPTHEEGPAADAKEPFAVKVEMAACPWQPQHRLARIAIKGREIGQDRQPSNLVFLVDVSGSMSEPNKLPLVQQSLRMLTEQLGENDRVSMVTYAGNTNVVLPSTSGQKKADIIAAIDRLQSGGGTHGSAGIRLAYEQAVSGFIKGGVNRVILCTDGDFNVGISSPEELETYITEKARSGVFLSLLGYGSGNLKDRTMETLADKGNGNYAYIDSLSEARKVLVEQMNGTLVTIAKDVKIQVEFNPAVIRSYRLIGYENRLLAKEDFNDDTKDAGEIGVGHSVTALYELVPANLAPGESPSPLVDNLKYQQPSTPPAPAASPMANSGEALTVKLRYKEPEGSTSKLIEIPVKEDNRDLNAASAEFKFTTAVAGFGLLLRQSSYAGQLTWEQVRELAIAGKGSDELGYRGEFIQLIEKARGVTR